MEILKDILNITIQLFLIAVLFVSLLSGHEIATWKGEIEKESKKYSQQYEHQHHHPYSTYNKPIPFYRLPLFSNGFKLFSDSLCVEFYNGITLVHCAILKKND